MAVNEAISEIMNAVNSKDLFSSNRKRAGIAYRRLMRQVHPDFDHSKEAKQAAERLNVLWEDWRDRFDADSKGKKTSNPRRPKSRLRKVARVRSTHGGTDAVVFHDDGRKDGSWIEVLSKPISGDTVRLSQEVLDGLNKLASMASGSPVLVPTRLDRVMLNQKDSQHESVRWTTIAPLKVGWTADVLRSTPEYKDGVNGRDLVWILKRLLYIDGILNQADLTVDMKTAVGEDQTLIAPEAHTVMLASPLTVCSIDSEHDGHGRPILDAASRLIGPATGREGKNLMMFINGCKGDNVTDTESLLRELDDLAYDLYGEPSYHAMKDPEHQL